MHSDAADRPNWPLHDQARVAIACSAIADFTRVLGKLDLPLQGDVFTDWFTTIGVTRYSEWKTKISPPP